MKQVVSALILAILVSPYAAPAFAQKSRSTVLRPTGLRSVAGPKSKVSPLPTATAFRSIAVYTDNSGVYLKWEMEAEIGNIGFNVYRVGKSGTELLNVDRLVLGAATHGREVPSFGESYNYFDRSGDGSSAYYVEARSLNGRNVTTHQMYPQYVSDLGSISGKTSAELAKDDEDSLNGDLEINALTFNKELSGEIQDHQQFADPVTHRFVISQPGVVRIGTRGEGMYRISRAELEAGGFNVNTDSSHWQLYLEGVQQAIIVGNNGDYIEFFGKGIDVPETDVRVYYLLNGATAGKRMGSRVARRGTSSVLSRSYAQTYVKKERTSFIDDVDNGEIENYFGRGVTSFATTLNFNLSGIDTSKPTARFFIQFMGYSFGEHILELWLNDVALATIDPEPPNVGEGYFGATYEIPTSLLVEGTNALRMRAAGPGDFVFFDQFHIDFDRKYLADQNKLAFYTQNYRAAKLTGFTSPNVRVFDVTHDGEPLLMTNLVFQQDGGSFGTEMPAARGRSFFAAEDSSLLSAVSITPNNPELVGVPTNGADLVIVSYKDFLPQAEAWASYRLSVEPQGFTVKVIDVSELYDEFNYGLLGSAGLRSFFDYAYNNWQVRPKYALLIGDASVDSRNYQNRGYWNLVPSKMVSAIFSETASDEALADFDNDGLAEIAIGRIASRDAAGITTVLNKVSNWEAQGASLDRGALFAYDHNDGYDFDGMSLRLRARLPATMPVTMVYRGEANANTNLIAAMNAGKYIVNYSGHGTTGSWGGSPVFFNINSVPTLTDSPNSPGIFTMLTCLNGAFHYVTNESFGEVLTKANNRGAVAAWASTGLTLPNIQERMATQFYGKVADGEIPRLGDLIRDAKSVLRPEDGGTDVRRSWALIGDPMLKVR